MCKINRNSNYRPGENREVIRNNKTPMQFRNSIGVFVQLFRLFGRVMMLPSHSYGLYIP